MSPRRLLIAALFALTLRGGSAWADHPPAAPYAAPEEDDLDASASELRPSIERFVADRRALLRSDPGRLSSAHAGRMERFYRDWLSRLESRDFDGLSREGKVDYLLFRAHLEHELRDLEIEASRVEAIRPLVPFAEPIVALEEARGRVEPIDPKALAAELAALSKRIEETKKAAERGLKSKKEDDGEGDDDAEEGESVATSKTDANRAARAVEDLRTTLRRWYGFYHGYDPLFTWWVAEPQEKLDKQLQDYATFLRERLVGVKADDDRTIVGDPIGREALLSDLASEMISYTPEELIAIADREMAWCEAEMKKAAADMGLGDDWKAALERVKTRYVEPGEQPRLIKELADEAMDFLEDRDLITIPRLARQTWRMQMMSPEAQLRNPFFLGGESIIVAFPTDSMAHDDKMMSLRGNNRHFARATVFHELIPGHNLQAFMTERYRAYRRPFGTPFWTEGWALYWEILLWDLGFPKSPEDRVGMLFWRMHRCARIKFSLGFHLGQMSPQECVDYLVDRVGHERANASAEVRRSFEGGYSPLYQCAYLLGGLQFRALRRELVESGKMTDRAFHDAVMRLNSIPVEMVRASLSEGELTRDWEAEWKFYPLDEE